MAMKSLLKLRNHETKDYHCDRLHNSKVVAEVCSVDIVFILMVSNKHIFFTFYSTINLLDIGLCIIMASIYDTKINLFISYYNRRDEKSTSASLNMKLFLSVLRHSEFGV